MTKYLADSWYFIALLDRFDNHRRSAMRLAERVRPPMIVTHYGVIHEVLAFFSAQGAFARAKAVEWARRTMRDASPVPIDDRLMRSALDLYAARPDKEYSLVDCISMVLMKSLGVEHVVTNDHHFAQEGFVVISE